MFEARALAEEQGIELSKIDQLMAIDSGDPEVAIDNYKRRNVPGYSEEQAGIKKEAEKQCIAKEQHHGFRGHEAVSAEQSEVAQDE